MTDQTRLSDEHAEELLRESGLSRETLETAGIFSVSAEEASEWLHRPLVSGGYVIPYPETGGF